MGGTAHRSPAIRRGGHSFLASLFSVPCSPFSVLRSRKLRHRSHGQLASIYNRSWRHLSALTVPMLITPTEARVLGSLIEKEISTPEYYPLSLNALVNASNQKNNREPVMHRKSWRFTMLCALWSVSNWQAPRAAQTAASQIRAPLAGSFQLHARRNSDSLRVAPSRAANPRRAAQPNRAALPLGRTPGSSSPFSSA